MTHIKKINEMMDVNGGKMDMKITILSKERVDILNLKNEYDNFEEFYESVAHGKDVFYEDYIYNEKENTVELVFNNGGNVTFKIEVSTRDVFELEKEIYD